MCFLGIFSPSERISLLLYWTWKIFRINWCSLFGGYTILLCTSQVYELGGERWEVSVPSYQGYTKMIKCCFSFIVPFFNWAPMTNLLFVPSASVPSTPARSPVVQIYSRRWETNDSYSAPDPSSSYPTLNWSCRKSWPTYCSSQKVYALGNPYIPLVILFPITSYLPHLDLGLYRQTLHLYPKLFKEALNHWSNAWGNTRLRGKPHMGYGRLTWWKETSGKQVGIHNRSSLRWLCIDT